MIRLTASSSCNCDFNHNEIDVSGTSTLDETLTLKPFLELHLFGLLYIFLFPWIPPICRAAGFVRRHYQHRDVYSRSLFPSYQFNRMTNPPRKLREIGGRMPNRILRLSAFVSHFIHDRTLPFSSFYHTVQPWENTYHWTSSTRWLTPLRRTIPRQPQNAGSYAREQPRAGSVSGGKRNVSSPMISVFAILARDVVQTV
jgi:hypothetical protein